MNYSNSFNSSAIEQCFQEMSSSLLINLVSLVTMDQTRPERHQNSEPTKYEVAVSLKILIVGSEPSCFKLSWLSVHSARRFASHYRTIDSFAQTSRLVSLPRLCHQYGCFPCICSGQVLLA